MSPILPPPRIIVTIVRHRRYRHLKAYSSHRILSLFQLFVVGFCFLANELR